jgi:hypothetical protein
MKIWLLLALISFILVAGFKYLGYQQHLNESNVEKERLSSVLSRARVTETSELKVIKPASKLTTNNDVKTLHPDSITTLNDEQEKQSAFQYKTEAETEIALSHFFASHPTSASFILERIQCEQQQCELSGEYYGSQSELTEVVNALEQEPWWHFTSPTLTTTTSQKGVKITMLFLSQPTDTDKRNSTQPAAG